MISIAASRIPQPQPPAFPQMACVPVVRAPAQQEVVHLVDRSGGLRPLFLELCARDGLALQTYDDLPGMRNGLRRGFTGCLVVDCDDFITQESDLSQLEGLMIPTIGVASSPTVRMTVHLVKSGIFGVLEKPLDRGVTRQTLSEALTLNRRMRAMLAVRAERAEAHERLTPRERQVMALVTAGKMNKQIAWELGLSEITVKVHRGSVMRKMGARSLAELVRMADDLRASPASACGLAWTGGGDF